MVYNMPYKNIKFQNSIFRAVQLALILARITHFNFGILSSVIYHSKALVM
jgi:hypothetical protein